MDNASSSPKQVPLVSESSSPEKMQLLFTPLIPASEPISVSNGSFVLSMFSEEILLKIWCFAGVEAMRNLIVTCKYFRNQLDTRFLQVLASENNPDRATSGFIVDAIGKESNICLWRNVKFLIKDHTVPKDLSIHLFASTTAEKISSDEVRSMIIQVSELLSPSDLFNLRALYRDIRKFLKFLFLKVSFKNLKCLMFCGITLSMEFSQEIGELNLEVFHMRNFRYHNDLVKHAFFWHCNSLKTHYVVNLDEDRFVYPPEKLEKLVIYCPKPSEDMIDGCTVFHNNGLDIDVAKCQALKEM